MVKSIIKATLFLLISSLFVACTSEVGYNVDSLKAKDDAIFAYLKKMDKLIKDNETKLTEIENDPLYQKIKFLREEIDDLTVKLENAANEEDKIIIQTTLNEVLDEYNIITDPKEIEKYNALKERVNKLKENIENLKEASLEATSKGK